MTIRDVLETVAVTEPRFARIDHASQVFVTVTMAGESRSYRSLFFWESGADAETVTYFPLDLITQGVQEAATEAWPVLPSVELYYADRGVQETRAAEPSIDLATTGDVFTSGGGGLRRPNRY